jgi:hypothetical protein
LPESLAKEFPGAGGPISWLVRQWADEVVQQHELRLLIGQLEEFVTKVRQNLATAECAVT